MMMIHKNKIARFYEQLNNTQNGIVVCSDQLSGSKLLTFRNSLKKHNFNIFMTIKRLLHKIYIGERNKNEKTSFPGNAYIINVQNDSNFDFIKRAIKKANANINGVIVDNKYFTEGNSFIKARFNSKLFVSIILNSSINLIAKIIYCIIKVKEQKNEPV